MKKDRVVNRITLIGITLALVFSLGLVYAPDLFAIESSTKHEPYAGSIG